MRNPRAAVLTAAIITATVLWPIPPTAAASGSESKWAVMPAAPSPGGAGGGLRDVAAIASDDVWVTGPTSTAHWNGTAWTMVAIPTAPAGSTYDLSAIDAVDSGHAWAVGGLRTLSPVNGSTTTAPAILHYDGRGWLVVPIPPPAGGTTTLNDVDMLTGDDGWAVGSTMDGTAPAQPLIMRWRSGQWAPVPAPAVGGTSAELSSVYAASEGDAWAVGSYLRADGRRTSLVLRWNGASWKQIVVPVADASADETLASVAALTATDVWAVGRTCSEGGLMSCRPLALHLLDDTWQEAPPATGGTEFVAVIPFSETDVWVLGYAVTTHGETDHVQHWDGVRFTVDLGIPPPGSGSGSTQGGLDSALAAGAATGNADEMWAVGWAAAGATNGSHAIRRAVVPGS